MSTAPACEASSAHARGTWSSWLSWPMGPRPVHIWAQGARSERAAVVRAVAAIAAAAGSTQHGAHAAGRTTAEAGQRAARGQNQPPLPSAQGEQCWRLVQADHRGRHEDGSLKR